VTVDSVVREVHVVQFPREASGGHGKALLAPNEDESFGGGWECGDVEVSFVQVHAAHFLNLAVDTQDAFTAGAVVAVGRILSETCYTGGRNALKEDIEEGVSPGSFSLRFNGEEEDGEGHCTGVRNGEQKCSSEETFAL